MYVYACLASIQGGRREKESEEGKMGPFGWWWWDDQEKKKARGQSSRSFFTKQTTT